MRNLYLVFISVLSAPLWAAPSFSDLDSWQLPAEPVAKPAAPARPATPPKVQRPAPDDEEEIKVEMTGNSFYMSATNTQDPDEIPIFRRSAAQLAKRLAGKSRFYVLFNANVVSTQDSILHAQNGTSYAFVRFGRDGDTYRKFLFEGRGDQKLLAVADDVPGVLKINMLYGINMGLSENDLKKAYPEVQATVVKNEQANKEYHSYQVNGPLFLIFENGQLVKQFASAGELSAFMQTLSAANTGVAAEQAREQTKLEQMRLEQQGQQVPPARPPFKALVEGGTVEDQMYLPRVVHPEDYDGAPLPPLTPSGPKAGTVLIRDVDGKYMNNK